MDQDCDEAALLEVIVESAFDLHEQQFGMPGCKCVEAIAILPSAGG
jgi:hypothetical protein